MSEPKAKSEPFLVALCLDGRACLVVGGGDEAVRRATALRRAGAVVHVVTHVRTEPRSDALDAMARSGEIALSTRSFQVSDLDGVWLAVQTARDAALSDELAARTKERAIFFCAVDRPEHGSYSHVALVRSGPVAVGISTSGRAPALSRRLREELERLFDAADLGAFAARLGALRDETRPEDRAAVLGEAVREVRFEGTLDLPKR